jgi:hypothetical protein
VFAYVFWHRPAAGVDPAAYEEALAEFHRALATAPPAGFAGSCCHRFDELPWLGEGGPGYEDWYLVPGWTALGELEAGAVRGAVRPPHDRAAVASAHGAGAIYGLAGGAAEAPASGERAWFAKPADRDYRELDRLLAPCLGVGGGGAALWRRRLVLGPAPENCVVGKAAGALPPELEVLEAAGALIYR